MKLYRAEDVMRSSVYEGVRWWFSFDGPMTTSIKANKGRATVEQIRAIASVYNFRRNIPSEEDRVELIADAVNAYSGTSFSTFEERASTLTTSIEDLHQMLVETSPKGKAFRIVSGMTKLTWFVSPTGWTPFDRLAAKAIGVRNADVVKRMSAYYDKLDTIGFSGKAAAIARHAKGTPFAHVTGERILDKFLMFHGEPNWTRTALPISNAFPDALPERWRAELLDFADKVATDPECRFDLRVKL